MTDGNTVLESSPSAGTLTAADVDLDFVNYEKSRNAERLAEATNKPIEKPEEVTDPKPAAAASAPAKVEAPVTEQADKTKPAVLTSEDVSKLLDTKLESLKPKETPKEDPKPLITDSKYQTVEEWENDLIAWTERKALAKGREEGRSEATTEITTKQQAEKAQADWDSRVAEAKTRHADYDQLVEIGKTRPYNETALEFIVKSPMGPDLFAHYVRNEQDWLNLIALPEAAIVAKLVLVEDRLEQGLKAAPAKEAPKAKTVSDALPPPKTLSGKASPADDSREKAVKEDDFEAYEAEQRRERLRNTRGQFV